MGVKGPRLLFNVPIISRRTKQISVRFLLENIANTNIADMCFRNFRYLPPKGTGKGGGQDVFFKYPSYISGKKTEICKIIAVENNKDEQTCFRNFRCLPTKGGGGACGTKTSFAHTLHISEKKK